MDRELASIGLPSDPPHATYPHVSGSSARTRLARTAAARPADVQAEGRRRSSSGGSPHRTSSSLQCGEKTAQDAVCTRQRDVYFDIARTPLLVRSAKSSNLSSLRHRHVGSAAHPVLGDGLIEERGSDLESPETARCLRITGEPLSPRSGCGGAGRIRRLSRVIEHKRSAGRFRVRGSRANGPSDPFCDWRRTSSTGPALDTGGCSELGSSACSLDLHLPWPCYPVFQSEGSATAGGARFIQHLAAAKPLPRTIRTS